MKNNIVETSKMTVEQDAQGTYNRCRETARCCLSYGKYTFMYYYCYSFIQRMKFAFFLTNRRSIMTFQWYGNREIRNGNDVCHENGWEWKR